MKTHPKLNILAIAFVLGLAVGCNNSFPVERLATATPTNEAIPTATLTPKPTSAPATVNTETATPNMSPEALVYLNNALDIMQENSINREQIDWDKLRAKVHSFAYGAQTLVDTYRLIRFALKELGDHHSSFATPTEAAVLQNLTVEDNPSPEGKVLEGKLAYIWMPRFRSTNEEQVNEYATRLQHTISVIDAKAPCGWIVDLRQNVGGNMYAMLAGIGPILGEGGGGSFVDPNGLQQYWSYTTGQALLDDNVLAKVNGPAYQLSELLPPVAVLTGKLTGSSGEAIVVAFRGRPNTRSFGSGTAGVPSGNQGYELSDGAMIILTTVAFADRTGHVYNGVIVPDEVADLSSSNNNDVVQAAIDWLGQQSTCISGK